jgi:hypothetical protein
MLQLSLIGTVLPEKRRRRTVEELGDPPGIVLRRPALVKARKESIVRADLQSRPPLLD